MTSANPASCETLLALFRIDTIQEVDAPAGCEGVWQRYVISQGSNTIVGMRSGALSDVNLALNGMVERLNLRFAKLHAKASGEKPAKKAASALTQAPST